MIFYGLLYIRGDLHANLGTLLKISNLVLHHQVIYVLLKRVMFEYAQRHTSHNVYLNTLKGLAIRSMRSREFSDTMSYTYANDHMDNLLMLFLLDFILDQ